MTHKRKQRGGRRVRHAHGEKTQRFPASPSDRQRPPANKSDAAKRQDAQNDVWAGEAAQSCGLPRERRRVGNVRAAADAHRGTERDEPGLI